MKEYIITNSKITFCKYLLIVVFALTYNLIFSQNIVKYPANNALDICGDMQFRLIFAEKPVLQNSGTINLYKIDGTLVESIDLSLTPTGNPLAATWPWSQNLSGTAVKVIKVSIEDKTAIISFANGIMNYSTGYYVTVDQNIFSNASVLGFKGIYPNQWSFTTKAKPVVDLDYSVAADGTGDFATLQGALDFIPSGNISKAKIYIKNGVYVGLISSKSKNNLTIEGESADGVILKGYNNANLNSTRYFAQFTGNDLYFINLTFINTTPNGGSQAESIYLSGDRNVIVNCNFFSYQDTVYISGKTYLKDCMIEGNVDFIWGNGPVFFQNCEIRTALRSGYNVQARNGSGARGYVFADCRITTASPTITGHCLGRDAGATYLYSEIVYLNCILDSHIAAKGWDLSRLTDASGALFAEYKSVDQNGNLIDISGRDAKSKQLTDAQNTQYRGLSWFFGGWTPVLPAYSTDKKPSVSISSPLNGALLNNTSSVILTASASDADGSVVKIVYYDGATKLDSVTMAPYTYTWSNPSLGSHIITAVATDNSGLKTTSAAVFVTVTVPVTGVVISAKSATVNKNETIQITATVQPASDTNKNVVWSSKNNSIATVNSIGIVTGVSEGNTYIYVTTEDGNKKDSCSVTVTNIIRPVTGITLTPTTATINKIETLQLTATIQPAIATNKTIIWTTSNNAVVAVSNSGLVTAVGVGSALIAVYSEDGGFKDTCIIEVIDPPLPEPLIKLGFNENTGTTINNQGSASATFTKAAIPAWSTNVPENGGAGSLDFGTTTGNNYVESNAVISQLAGLSSFTITGWVNCVSSAIGQGGNRIVSWINNGANGVDVVNIADGSIKVGINQWPDNTVAISSAGKIKVNASAPASNWVFFATTYNSANSTLKFFFGDNTNKATIDKTITYAQGAVGTTIGKLCIGHFNTESLRATRSDRMFRGLIDQIGIYNSVLTLNNIQTVQNIGLINVLPDNIQTNTDLNFKLYPNPVISELKIDIQNNYSDISTITLLDFTGKIIVSQDIKQSTETLNISGIPAGIYLIKVYNNAGNITKRFIKQ